MTDFALMAEWGQCWADLQCTRCGNLIRTFQVPAGFLDDPYFGPFLCGACAVVVRPVELAA